MTRPLGSKNRKAPEPPFVLEFGEHAKVRLTPKQVAGETEGESVWAFDVAFENARPDEMTIDDLSEVGTMAKLSSRWGTKMDSERKRLEAQLEELQKKLAFLKR
ncbi:MAG TPA: hypothetical protein VII15_05715 [Candidatus Cryosericum sp.]